MSNFLLSSDLFLCCADWSEEEKKNLAHELSDVLIYLVRLAERCHIGKKNYYKCLFLTS